VCVVGENGSGKSTMLKGILRLLKPVKGVIQYEKSLKPWEMGYLPQQIPVKGDFPASVYEVVLSGRLNLRGIRFLTKKDRRKAMEYMERLGIMHLCRYCYGELSGGQRQRVLLARAMCAAHKILLLDEPTAGLDPLVTRELYDQVRSINRSTGMTIVMASHDVANAVGQASHILHLQKIQMFYGETEEYVNSEAGALYVSHA
jgi:zinc transport system ATP-binding protein